MHDINFPVIAGLLALILVVRSVVRADWKQEIEKLTETALTWLRNGFFVLDKNVSVVQSGISRQGNQTNDRRAAICL